LIDVTVEEQFSNEKLTNEASMTPTERDAKQLLFVLVAMTSILVA